MGRKCLLGAVLSQMFEKDKHALDGAGPEWSK